MEIFFIIGAIQAVFQSFLIFNKKNKGTPDFILGTWMLFIALHLSTFYFGITGLRQSWPYIQGIEAPLPTVQGPFLLLYIQSQSGLIKRFGWKQLLHFTPALLLYIGYIPNFLMTPEELIAWVSRPFESWKIILNTGLNIVSGVIYITWSIIQLRKHREVISKYFSFREKISLNWLNNLIIGMIAIWLVIILQLTFNNAIPGLPDFFRSAYPIFFTVVLFTFSMGYFGIKQGLVFNEEIQIDEPTSKPESTEKYQKSNLKEAQAEEYERVLKEFMVTEKPYLESKLTLRQLSSKTNIGQHHLSQVLNERIGKSFYEFVNSFRVEEFKSSLTDPKKSHLTLLGHALESGFSSKSTFNDIFKKVEGKTPSEHFKSIKKGLPN
ncbi:MAG: helix-turn-helix domain-containing protein [bacterium]|nr:helix-turn-helix domain-containing protein [bacterium]